MLINHCLSHNPKRLIIATKTSKLWWTECTSEAGCWQETRRRGRCSPARVAPWGGHGCPGWRWLECVGSCCPPGWEGRRGQRWAEASSAAPAPRTCAPWPAQHGCQSKQQHAGYARASWAILLYCVGVQAPKQDYTFKDLFHLSFEVKGWV